MKNMTAAQGAFIARILIEAYQSKGQRILEAGYTGQKKDKLGHTRYYADGRQVKNPNATEKANINAAASTSLPAGQSPSSNDAATRVDALHADTPPEHVAALANDLMKMSVEDLTKLSKGPAAEDSDQDESKEQDDFNRIVLGKTFKDKQGNEYLAHSKRHGKVTAFPIVDGKPVVNNQSAKYFAVTKLAKLQNAGNDNFDHGLTADDFKLKAPDEAPAPKEAPAVKPTPTETKAAAAAEKATDSGEQKGIGEAGELLSLDTATIKVDPTRFQYKQKLDSTTGAGDNLKNVSKFNSLFAGVVHAWKDPADGQVYVVNGHHRMELANRAGHKKMNVQMILAPDAATARSTGALINMAEGRGTALDAAKFLRESGQTVEDMKGHGVSLKEKVVDNAVQLKGLSNRIFNDLASGILDEDKAVAIGRHLKDHSQQEQLYNHYLEQKDKTNKDFNAATLEQAAIDISRTPTKSGGGQMDLFGNNDDGKSLFLEKAELKTKIRNMLTQEVNDYAMAGNARRAKNIAGAGNVLQVDKNKDLSKEADRIKQAYEQFQHLSGPLSDAINAHVEEYANAKGSKKAIVEKSLADVRSAIHEIIDGTNKNDVRASGQNPQDDQGTGGERQADLPGDVRGGNAQDVGPSLFGEPQDEEPKPADAAKADEPGFTGIDAQGRQWQDGELVAAKDEPTAPDPVAVPEPAAAVKGMSPEALALDAIRLKSNKKPHNPAHINLEAMGGLMAKGFVDSVGKLTDAGREHLYAQKGKTLRKATGPKVKPAAPAPAQAEAPAAPAAEPAKKAPTGGEKYFGVGGGNVAVTLRNGKKGVIPPPMEVVPGWKEYEEQNYPNGPLPPKSFYNLNESEATEHREAQELIRREWVNFRRDYLAKNGTFDPDSGELVSITLNCDDWRDQFPTYVGTNSGTIHDAASYANMRMLNEAMALMKGKGNNQFLVLGGGGGSGKGTATKDIIKAGDYPVVLDSVSDDSAWTKELMDMAKGHGYGGQFVFIDRAPQDAWKDGVVKRAMESREKFNAGDKTSLARTVPLSVALPANLKARRAAFELLEDGQVPTMIINNNLGFGKAREVVGEEAAAYLQTGMNGYNKEQLLKEMEDDTYGLYESGKIPDDIAKGLISAKTIAARRIQPRPIGGSDSGGPPDGRGTNTDSQGTSNQAPVDGGTGQGSSSAGKSGQGEVDDPVARHMKRQAFTGIDSQGREWRNGELVAAKDDEPAAAPEPAAAEPAQAGPAPDDDEPIKSNYFTSNAEIPQWAKDAGYDKRKLKKRGLSQATVEKVEDHANQIIKSVATFIDSPEGQANHLKKRLLHQLGISGGMDSALNQVARQYWSDSQRDSWNPNSGPAAAKIAQSLEKLRTDLQSKLNALQHPKAAEPTPAAAAPDENDDDRSMPEHEAVRQVYLLDLPKTTTDQVLRRLNTNLQWRRKTGKISGSNAYTQSDIKLALEEVLEQKQENKEFKKNLEQALQSQKPNLQPLIQERGDELAVLTQAKEKKGYYGVRSGEDHVRRMIGDAKIKIMNLNQKIIDLAAKAPAGNTDLFGNPSKATAPKGPETMPGLFGDAVPVAPDAPATAAGEPLPGSDNPLDRAGAGRGRQDATQDMFGLFGPATKNKIDQINNGPGEADAQPVTPPAAAEPAALSAKAPGVSLSDVPYDLAFNAHRGTSFVPEKRASYRQQSYVDQMQADWEHLSQFAKTPQQQEILKSEFAQYKAGYLARTKAQLSADSRILSPMISGPARFPTNRNNKANSASEKRQEETVEFRKRALFAAAKAINPVTSRAPVLSRDDAAVQTLTTQVEALEKIQDHYKKMNAGYAKFVKNPASLATSGLSEKEQATIKAFHEAPKDQGDSGKPYPSYRLTNNGANIRRIRDRIDTLSKLKAMPEKEEKYSGGVSINHDPDDARIRIKFPGKPSPEVIKQIKSRGFIWSPSYGTWQRQLNGNGTYAADELMKALGHEKITTEAVKPATDPHAAKIKLIQAIIARRGIKPPQPKAQAKKIPEASDETDPRVKRIRELMAAYC